jgi:hypothetical protein
MVGVLTRAIVGQLLFLVPLLATVSAGRVADSTNERRGCIALTVKDGTVLRVRPCDGIQRHLFTSHDLGADCHELRVRILEYEGGMDSLVIGL